MRHILLCLIMILPFAGYGQTISDALRYSVLEYTGTARNIGAGSAMAPFGADFGAIALQTAGLVTFKRSEISISPGVRAWNNEANLVGSTNGFQAADRTQLSLLNFGAVFTWYPEKGNWTRLNLGIGFNNQGNYGREVRLNGLTQGSITQRFVELSNGLPLDMLDAFEAGPAYDAFVTFKAENEDVYGADVTAQHTLEKFQTIESSGSNNELVFSLGAALEEKLQLGFSLGVPFVNFTEDKRYTEINPEQGLFRELVFEEYLDASGTGINAKLGLIFRPVQEVFVSAAFHSPTWYSINENFTTGITYDYEFDPQEFPEPGPQTAESPFGEFDYWINTPWRVNGGIGWLIQRSGFLSADLEFVDYGSANFDIDRGGSTYRDLEDRLNRDIDRELGTALNMRFGGEWALGKFRLRGGLGLMASPFVNEDGFEQVYSGGLGIREDNFYIDFAYRYRQNEFNYLLYQLEDEQASPLVRSNEDVHLFAVTLGFKL